LQLEFKWDILPVEVKNRKGTTMAKLMREERYIKSDVENNNNKFWYIFEHDDCSVLTEWGRVGKTSQSKTKTFGSQGQATSFFDKKCGEKERSGRNGEIAYRKLNVVSDVGGNTTKTSPRTIAQSELAGVAVKQISGDLGSKQTADLIRYLAKVNQHNILSTTTMTYNNATGLFSTPCGIVTQNTLDEANDLLVEISDHVAKNDFENKTIRQKTGDYLMLVPQEVGRKLDVRVLFPDLSAIQQQKALLDSLQASLDTVLSGKVDITKKAKEAKPQEQVFSVKLNLVSDSNIIDRIKKKYQKTLHSNHACSHLKVKEVFSVEIASMKAAFEIGKKVGNVHEYWHGTRAFNLLSILKSGLIIPSANASNVTGRMFGPGVYFSSESTKSLNYSFGYWGGGSRDSNCFMLLADVAMGKYYVPKGGWGSNYPVAGYDSTWAKAHESGVQNHEMIIYKLNQCNLTYLIEFAR